MLNPSILLPKMWIPLEVSVHPDMVEEISMRFMKATALYAFNVG